MAGMVGWTELDRRITDNGKKEHPIAAFIDGLRTDSETWTSRSAKHFELVKEAIDDYMVFSTTKRPHMYRLRDPLSFERASPFAVPVGSEVDLSDLRVRTDTTI
ncbi:hypothetical protein BDF19DRAFT_451022 [Syncephalis fuscata]|nr:hypothetical protein BDF19DRAFT_451022 [Syncephalis fuscata]